MSANARIAGIIADRWQLDPGTTVRYRDDREALGSLVGPFFLSGALFDEPAVERKWLRTAQPALDGVTPLSLIEKGDPASLAKLEQFVRELAGH